MIYDMAIHFHVFVSFFRGTFTDHWHCNPWQVYPRIDYRTITGVEVNVLCRASGIAQLGGQQPTNLGLHLTGSWWRHFLVSHQRLSGTSSDHGECEVSNLRRRPEESTCHNWLNWMWNIIITVSIWSSQEMELPTWMFYLRWDCECEPLCQLPRFGDTFLATLQDVDSLDIDLPANWGWHCSTRTDFGGEQEEGSCFDQFFSLNKSAYQSFDRSLPQAIVQVFEGTSNIDNKPGPRL